MYNDKDVKWTHDYHLIEISLEKFFPNHNVKTLSAQSTTEMQLTK